jgi:hypothetical protein
MQRAATGAAFQTHTTEAAVALVLNPFAAAPGVTPPER